MMSPAKSKALAIAPKFTAFLSICGSLGIVLKVLFNERRRKTTMHRIVMGMSFCDILASIWYFTGTWAIPADTMSWFGDGHSEKIFWAAGDANGVSCNFAGFFNQFAVATPLYNSTLAVYYLLVVNYGWRDSKILKIEWVFHFIPVGYALITSIFAVAADLYGHVEWTCWILPDELFDEDKELTPIQKKFQWIQWIFLFGAVWTCIIVVTVIFIILYRKMKSLENTMKRYPYSSTFSSTRTRSGTSTSFFSRKFSSRGESSKGDFSKGDFSKGDFSKDESHETEQMECAPKSDIESGDVVLSTGDNENSQSSEGDSSEQRISKPSDPVPKIDSTSHTTQTDSSDTQPQEKEGKSIVSWIKSSLSKEEPETSSVAPSRQIRREVRKSKKIAVQGLLYVGAFYITWLFPTISRITELVAKKNYFAIQFLDTFLIPLQGFFNFMIYIRPRFMKYRSDNPDEGFWKAAKTVVFEIKID